MTLLGMNTLLGYFRWCTNTLAHSIMHWTNRGLRPHSNMCRHSLNLSLAKAFQHAQKPGVRYSGSVLWVASVHWWVKQLSFCYSCFASFFRDPWRNKWIPTELDARDSLDWLKIRIHRAPYLPRCSPYWSLFCQICPSFSHIFSTFDRKNDGFCWLLPRNRQDEAIPEGYFAEGEAVVYHSRTQSAPPGVRRPFHEFPSEDATGHGEIFCWNITGIWPGIANIGYIGLSENGGIYPHIMSIKQWGIWW